MKKWKIDREKLINEDDNLINHFFIPSKDDWDNNDENKDHDDDDYNNLKYNSNNEEKEDYGDDVYKSFKMVVDRITTISKIKLKTKLKFEISNMKLLKNELRYKNPNETGDPHANTKENTLTWK